MTDDSESQCDPHESREERIALRRLWLALAAVAVCYGVAYWWFHG
jgi:hypothetical protein